LEYRFKYSKVVFISDIQQEAIFLFIIVVPVNVFYLLVRWNAWNTGLGDFADFNESLMAAIQDGAGSVFI
jgi:hypothetical protein